MDRSQLRDVDLEGAAARSGDRPIAIEAHASVHTRAPSSDTRSASALFDAFVLESVHLFSRSSPMSHILSAVPQADRNVYAAAGFNLEHAIHTWRFPSGYGLLGGSPSCPHMDCEDSEFKTDEDLQRHMQENHAAAASAAASSSSSAAAGPQIGQIGQADGPGDAPPNAAVAAAVVSRKRHADEPPASPSSAAASSKRARSELESELRKLTVVELKEKCREQGFSGYSSLKKAALIERLLNPVDSDKVKKEALMSFFETDTVEATRAKLVHIASLAYPPAVGAGNGLNSIQHLLQQLNTNLAAVRTQKLRIGYHADLGKAKSYSINHLLMEGCKFAPHVGSCLDKACTPDSHPCCGHAGPLPSAMQSGSVTTFVCEVSTAEALKILMKDGMGVVIDSLEFVPGVFDLASVAQVCGMIRKYSGRTDLTAEISGPFPGLLSLQAAVREQLPPADQSLFNGVVFVDLPGKGDTKFPTARRFQAIGSCDFVFFRQREDAGRTGFLDDIVELVAAGALSSFIKRSTLVFMLNLERDLLPRDSNGRTPAFAEFVNNTRADLRSSFKLLVPDVDGLEPQPVDQQSRTTLTQLQEDLEKSLSNSACVQVQSVVEGEALFQKAGEESEVFIFSSDNNSKFADAAAAKSNQSQLVELLVKEVTSKCKIGRIYPLLDQLQKVSKLLGRKVAQFIYKPSKAASTVVAAEAPAASFTARIEALKKKKEFVQPQFGFERLGLDTRERLSTVLDDLQAAIAALRDGAAYQRLADLLTTAPFLDSLKAEMRRLIESAFQSVLQRFDRIIDEAIGCSSVDPVIARESAPRGFYRVALEQHLRERIDALVGSHPRFMSDHLEKTLKLCVKMSRRQDVSKWLDLLNEEKLTASESTDSQDEGEGACATAAVEGKNGSALVNSVLATDTAASSAAASSSASGSHAASAAAASSSPSLPNADPLAAIGDSTAAPHVRRSALELLLRLILHQALDWNRVNKKTAKSDFRDKLHDIVTSLIAFSTAGIAEHFAELPNLSSLQAAAPASLPAASSSSSSSSPSPTLSREDAKLYATEIDDCAKRIRAAMRSFNPSYGPPDVAQVLLAGAEPVVLPSLYDDVVGLVGNSIYTPPTAEDLAERPYQDGSFRLLPVVSRLRIFTKLCVREMQKAGLLEPEHPETRLPKDAHPGSKMFAAALIKASCANLGLALPEDRGGWFEKVEPAVLAHAHNLVWTLKPSNACCKIGIQEPVQPPEYNAVAGIGPESPTDQQVWHHRSTGNTIVVIERDLNGRVFHARMSASDHDMIANRVIETGSPENKSSIAPIFMPSRRCGVDESTGNIWLDAISPLSDPQQQIQLGLEGQPTHLFVIIEPRNIYRFMQTFGAGSAGAAMHRNVHITWILLPVNFAFFGMAITIGKLFAEAFNFPSYWTIDDDCSMVEQYANPGRWFKASFRRCLLFGQQVLQHQLNTQYTPMDDRLQSEVIRPVTENITRTMTLRAQQSGADMMQVIQLVPQYNYVGNTITAVVDKLNRDHGLNFNKNPRPYLDRALKSELATLKSTCPLVEGMDELLRTAVESLEANVRSVGRLKADSIAGVSISHFLAKKSDYVHKKLSANYRSSEQRYQFVLHNTDAVRGYNMVPDDTLFADLPWHNKTRVPDSLARELKEWRENKLSGCKGPDRPWTRVLRALGKVGYQIYNFAHMRLHFNEEEDKKAWETSQFDGSAAEAEESGMGD